MSKGKNYIIPGPIGSLIQNSSLNTKSINEDDDCHEIILANLTVDKTVNNF